MRGIKCNCKMIKRTFKFTACKHLDFEPHFHLCKRQVLGSNNKVFWLRDLEVCDDNNFVQFCKIIGRKNDPNKCLEESYKGCDRYEEANHIVEITEEELGS